MQGRRSRLPTVRRLILLLRLRLHHRVGRYDGSLFFRLRHVLRHRRFPGYRLILHHRVLILHPVRQSRNLNLPGAHLHGRIVKIAVHSRQSRERLLLFVKQRPIVLFPQHRIILRQLLTVFLDLVHLILKIVPERGEVYGVAVVLLLHIARLHIDPRHSQRSKHECRRGNHDGTFLLSVVPSIPSHRCLPFLV